MVGRIVLGSVIGIFSCHPPPTTNKSRFKVKGYEWLSDTMDEIDFNKIPISKNLESYLKKYKKLRVEYLFNGDDYQILFTAPKKKRLLIKSIGRRMNQKLTIIGKININKKNLIKQDNKPLKLGKFIGYSHKF